MAEVLAEVLERRRAQSRESSRRYRETYPERVRESQRISYKKWLDANKEKHREKVQRWRKANPEKARELDRKWYRANREKVIAKAARQRAQRLGAFVADVDREEIYERDGWTCQICGEPVDPAAKHGATAKNRFAASLDHIVPLSCGGTHEPANVQLAHFSCNSAKGAK